MSEIYNARLRQNITFAVVCAEIVAQIPFFFIEETFAQRLISCVIVGLIAAYVAYRSTKYDNEYTIRNRNKFWDGEVAEIVPLEKALCDAKSDLEFFLLQKGKFYAVNRDPNILVIMIYEKDGEIYTAKQRLYSEKQFVKHFVFSDESSAVDIETVNLSIR